MKRRMILYGLIALLVALVIFSGNRGVENFAVRTKVGDRRGALRAFKKQIPAVDFGRGGAGRGASRRDAFGRRGGPVAGARAARPRATKATKATKVASVVNGSVAEDDDGLMKGGK